MDYINMNILVREDQIAAVYALLAGDEQIPATESKSASSDTQEEGLKSSGNGSTATNAVSPSEEPAAPKRRGRPPKAKSADAAEQSSPSNIPSVFAEDAGEEIADDAEASSDEEDEFAAFREAAAEPEKPAEVPARKWTDADIGSLCNQAAQKLGDATNIKALIAKYVPEGEVVHSRNIPQDKREEFAQAIEAMAGIKFAG